MARRRRNARRGGVTGPRQHRHAEAGPLEIWVVRRVPALMILLFTRVAAAATALMGFCVVPTASAAPAAPPNGGTISVEQVVASDSADQPGRAIADAVSGALGAKGFTILDGPGHSAYTAELSLSRTDVGTGSAKVATGRGAVVPGASAGVGAGLTVPLSTKKFHSVPLRRIQLEIRIRKRGQDVVLWRGAAVTVRAAGTEQGSDGVVASDLSEAILRDYPFEPPEEIGVP